MKKVILALICSATLFSCAEKQLKYQINGSSEGLSDGEKVYIQYKNADTKEIIKIDSTEVKDGKFKLNNILTSIGEFDLSTNYGSKTIILSDNPLDVVIKVTEKEGRKGVVKMAQFTFSGDNEQAHYAAFINAQTIGMVGTMGVAFMYPKALEEGNVPLQDSILRNYETSLAMQDKMTDSLVVNFPDSYMAAIIIGNIYSKSEKYVEVLARYNKLSDRVKQSAIGVKTKNLLDEIAKTAVGQPAPDFKAPQPNGEELSLSSLKGKYVLIDFWASWCAPCLAEVPNVKAVYDKYSSKGFEILSVSLDEDREKWLGAIEKYELNWKHVSTLKGWKCEIAKQYNVSGVPSMILIDKDGRIVSNDLRGEKLEITVGKLIDNQ